MQQLGSPGAILEGIDKCNSLGVQGLDDLWSGDFDEWINLGVTDRGTEGSTERGHTEHGHPERGHPERVHTERVPLPNASPSERVPKPLAL